MLNASQAAALSARCLRFAAMTATRNASLLSLSVRFDNNRQIEFNPNEHRHLDHGYAVTSHSSQGLTAERLLVHGDTSVHPDLLNSRFAYVSISRASLDAKIYTNDTAELGQRLTGEVSKSSAIEFSHSTANAMADLSLGQGI
jgi:ATP-dependent exoDNAse (exonuclease V) alpha subunit